MPARPDERPSRVFRGTRRYTLAARRLGLRLRAMRKAREWTLEKTSEKTGLELSHIQQIEAGKINVTLATLLRIADGLGAPLHALFEPEDSTEHGTSGGGTRRSGARSSTSGRSDDANLSVGVRRNPATGAMADPGRVVAAVGSAIRGARKKAGLTQQQVADLMGVSVKYVQRVEAGGANLTIMSMVRLANALGTSAPELLPRAG